jgi:UDP-4-amino-4,6-dideoxy-N-acetyl-beta-L-altrosamine transaminase
MMKPIPYGRQHITDEDIEAVKEVLQSDFLTQGPKVTEFEEKFAEYIGSKYAVAVANGTAALHLAAMAMEVNSKTNVIVSPITFAADGNCIRYCGGNVYFADIDPLTFNLDIKSVKRLIDSKPEGFFQGIIPVDFAGRPVELDALRDLAQENDMWIIEDACHAPGAHFFDIHGTRHNCGSGYFAELAVFSFHPVKHIATGEGGMITTNNIALYEKLKLLRTHGITKEPGMMEENHGGWYYEMVELGYNYRLSDILAALGISQLKKADAGMQRRQEIAKKYHDAFLGTNVITPQQMTNGLHAYHLYIVQVENRKGLYDHLKANQIHCQVHYVPMHLLPYYKNLGHKAGEVPVAEAYYEKCLSLPMFPSLTDAEQNYVIEKVLEFV